MALVLYLRLGLLFFVVQIVFKIGFENLVILFAFFDQLFAVKVINQENSYNICSSMIIKSLSLSVIQNN